MRDRYERESQTVVFPLERARERELELLLVCACALRSDFTHISAEQLSLSALASSTALVSV